MQSVPPTAGPTDRPPATTAILGRSLRLNLVYAIIGTGVFNACRACMVMLMTKFGAPAIVGQFDYALQISAPIVMFCALNLRAVLIADSRNAVPFGNYLMTRTLGMAAAGVVLMGVVGWRIFSDWQAAAPLDIAFLVIIIGVCVSKLIESEAEIFWGLYQKDERMDLVAWSNCLRGLGMLLSFAIGPPLIWMLVNGGTLSPDKLSFGTAIAVIGYLLCWAAVAVFFDRRQSRRRTHYDPSWSWPEVRKLILRALPLGIVILFISLTTSIPRLIVAGGVFGDPVPDGLKKLGYFANLAYLLQLGNLLVVQLGYTTSNRLAIYFRDNPPAFVRLVGKMMLMAGGMGALTIAVTLIAGRWLLTKIYTPEYAAYYPEFMILVAAQSILFFSSLLGFAVTQMQIYWLQVLISGMMCAAAAITAWLLVPKNPVSGAAYAMLATSIVQVVALGATLIVGLKLRHKILARAAGPTAASGDPAPAQELP